MLPESEGVLVEGNAQRRFRLCSAVLLSHVHGGQVCTENQDAPAQHMRQRLQLKLPAPGGRGLNLVKVALKAAHRVSETHSRCTGMLCEL